MGKLLKVKGAKKYVFFITFLNIVSLGLNIFLNYNIAMFLTNLVIRKETFYFGFKILALVILFTVIVNFYINIKRSTFSNDASKKIKFHLREELFKKFYALGQSYVKYGSSGEIVNLSVKGIEDLDMFYGKFLPQLMYSLLAPIVLFIYLSRYSLKTAFVLFVFVPLIPISIMMVQKLAKKITQQYFKSFVNLSDRFLDYLEGFTILKVYGADGEKNREMNEEAEAFRKATMKVLVMQLNNINIMDFVAYGGSSIGIFYGLMEFYRGNLDLFSTILFILLAVEFFLPLRLLGSYFHVAMNGISSSEIMFQVLDKKEPEDKEEDMGKFKDITIKLKDLCFSYKGSEKEILKNVNMEIKPLKLTVIAGKSGSGKSTVASIITGMEPDFKGEVLFNDLGDVFTKKSKLETITLVDNDPYFFEGTVRYNLKMGKKDATDLELENVLKEVSLYEFFKGENGLDTKLSENARNLSGGQRQRLAVARALLKDSKVYILDEATSNIDRESEDIILNLFLKLKKEKTIVLISHRLNIAKKADYIYFIEEGRIKEEGNFNEITENPQSSFKKLYDFQISFENFKG